MYIQNLFAKILYKFSKISNLLKLHFIAQLTNRLARKIDIFIYDDDHFLQYVVDKHSMLYKNINTIETIAIRDSLADYGFNPKYFPNSYNLGLTSLDLQSTYLQYKSIIKEAKKLKNIILFSSFPMIGFSLSRTTEKNRLIAYHSVFDIPIPSQYQLKKRYIKHIKRKLKHITPSVTENFRGYKDIPAPITGEANIQHRINTHTRENKREPDQLNWLKRIIEISQKNKHNLFIVLPPYRKDYKDNMPHFEDGYKKLLALDFKSSKVLDFHNSKLFNDSDFGDTDHLNKNGAKKLTSELYSIISKQ